MSIQMVSSLSFTAAAGILLMGISQANMNLALALYSGEDPGQAVELEDGHYVWRPYKPATRRIWN